jgi:hypothetical protein
MQSPTLLVVIAFAAASVAVAGPALANGAASVRQQRFTFTGKTVSGKNLPIRVSAVGPIHATGTARIAEHAKTSDATFAFPKGNLHVLFVHGPTSARPDPAKCRATINARGTYTIRGGTGVYSHARGEGTYTEKRLLTGRRSPAGTCLAGPSAKPKSITAVATMRGTATLS